MSLTLYRAVTSSRRPASPGESHLSPALVTVLGALALSVAPAAGQEIDLVNEFTAPDTVRANENFAHRFTVTNIGSSTAWELELMLRATGTKSIIFGGLEQRRTRYGHESEAVSREKPILVRCTFGRRYLAPGRKVWRRCSCIRTPHRRTCGRRCSGTGIGWSGEETGWSRTPAFPRTP